MNALSLLISFKLAVTLFLIAGPFLFLPSAKLERRLSISASTPTFFRLYGMAAMALGTAYAFGLWFAWHGTFPWTVVSMGIVSNCGAAIILFRNWTTRRLRPQAVLFGAIGVGFVLSALFPEKVLTSLI